MRAYRSTAALWTAMVALAALGCSAEDASPGATAGGVDAGADAPHDAADPLDGSLFDAPYEGGSGDPCPEELESIFVITTSDVLMRFDPAALTFTEIGVTDCPDPASPWSMSVDRNGVAWVLYGGGNIYHVSTKTAACAPSGYQVGQAFGFAQGGMGFVTDAPGGGTETLYMHGGSGYGGIGKIDPASLTLTAIAPFDEAYKQHQVELTGTGDARLFGIFVKNGTFELLAEIDRSDAKLLSKAPLGFSGLGGFAMAFWGGSFWMFAGDTVQHFDPSTGELTPMQTYEFTIVGAGVSTCAPLEPPK